MCFVWKKTLLFINTFIMLNYNDYELQHEVETIRNVYFIKCAIYKQFANIWLENYTTRLTWMHFVTCETFFRHCSTMVLLIELKLWFTLVDFVSDKIKTHRRPLASFLMMNTHSGRKAARNKIKNGEKRFLNASQGNFLSQISFFLFQHG